jgi:hypothetical protein
MHRMIKEKRMTAEHATDLDDLARVCDDVLLDRLRHLLAADRSSTARLIAHLGEVDARGLYRDQAYSSMFDYCVRALHMSEAEAFTRIRTARTSRRYPIVLAMLERGELHLSAIKLLSPELKPENHHELLLAARFKTKKEVESILARRFPKPDAASIVRKLPGSRARPGTVETALPLMFERRGEAPQRCAPVIMVPSQEGQESIAAAVPPSKPKAAAPPSMHTDRLESHPAVRHAIDPLSANRYRVQFTASERLHEKIRQAQHLMRHQLPSNDLAALCERALDVLIAERMKERLAVVAKPRHVTRTARDTNTRHIPHAVRRSVLARDGQRCTYVAEDGTRCTEGGLLEFHHDYPHGRGGPATLGNIRMLCRAHNQLLAERVYGRTYMRKRVNDRQRGLFPEPHHR